MFFVIIRSKAKKQKLIIINIDAPQKTNLITRLKISSIQDNNKDIKNTRNELKNNASKNL